METRPKPKPALSEKQVSEKAGNLFHIRKTQLGVHKKTADEVFTSCLFFFEFQCVTWQG